MTASAQKWRVTVAGHGETSAIFTPSSMAAGPLFVCAHGAGGHMDDASMRAVCERLRSRGLSIVRFNFLYRERSSNRPDPMPVLKACFDAVTEHTHRLLQPQRLIIGGRSMGGRVASMLAADSYACDALLLLAYPLHPAGQPQKLRDAHLERIDVPALCINGTRDALCTRELMQQIVDRLDRSWTMHWLEGADHSFRVLKSSDPTDDDVLDEVADTSIRWLHLHGQMKIESFKSPRGA